MKPEVACPGKCDTGGWHMDQIMGRSKGLKTVLQKRQIDAGPVISYVRFTGEYILLTLGRFSLTLPEGGVKEGRILSFICGCQRSFHYTSL
jgi:hypothetical protein